MENCFCLIRDLLSNKPTKLNKTTTINDILHKINNLKNISDVFTVEMMPYLTLLEPTDVGLVELSLSLMSRCLCDEKATMVIDDDAAKDMALWLISALEVPSVVAKQSLRLSILGNMKVLLRAHRNASDALLQMFLHPDKGLLLHHLERILDGQYKEKDHNHGAEVKATVHIIDILLNKEGVDCAASDMEVCTSKRETLEAVGAILLRIHFTKSTQFQGSLNAVFFPVISIPLLTRITRCCVEFARRHLDEILGLCKAYMHFHADGGRVLIITKLYESQDCVHNWRERHCHDNGHQPVGGKVLKIRKPRAITRNLRTLPMNGRSHQRNERHFEHHPFAACDSVDLTRSSDSESEPEVGGDGALDGSYVRVRLAAMQMITVLVKVLERSVFYGYWFAMFPSEACSNDGLLHVVLCDPNVYCRIAALQAATQLLFGASKFLEHAETIAKRPPSYLPFSMALGDTIHATYDILVQAFCMETSRRVLTHLLQCLAVLVQATPFHRLRAGFIGRLIGYVRRLIHNGDISVQVSALMVMEFLVATPNMTAEIAAALHLPFGRAKKDAFNRDSSLCEPLSEVESCDEYVESENDDDEHREADERADAGDNGGDVADKGLASITEDCWLLTVLLQNLSVQQEVATAPAPVPVPAAIRIESLQVLTSMCGYVAVVIKKLDMVAAVLGTSLLDALPDVRLYSSKCLDTLGYNVNKYLVAVRRQSRSHALVLKCQHFWTQLLPLLNASVVDKAQTNTMRVCLCDSVSNIGCIVYNRLSHRQQMSVLSCLSGIAGDDDEQSVVRAAAVRALAVFALFPTLRGDLVFLENTAVLAINLAADRNLLVRVKALWSVGNLSDALLSGNDDHSNGSRRICCDTLNRLINVALQACKDYDKVRWNAVRALGNLLQLLDADMLDDVRHRQTLQAAVQKLVDCVQSSGNAKVKWNCCHAIGSLMKNRVLFEVSAKYAHFAWHLPVLPALCRVITDNANFKVRINATIALTNIPERAFFGDHFDLCWSSLLIALEKSYELETYVEYNHRDCLQERLCIALEHIVHLAGDADYVALSRELAGKIEIVHKTLFRVVNRMSPERAAPLLACPLLLEERLRTSSSALEQHNAIELIAKAFAVTPN